MKSKIITNICKYFRRWGTFHLHSQKEADDVNHTPNTEEFERCVACGALTDIPLSMPIERRKNYVIGIGQICAECAKAQWTRADKANVLSEAQILRALERSREEIRKK